MWVCLTKDLNVSISTVYFFSFFSLISLIADGLHHYHPACGPVHAFTIFYRDASSALLQLVNQWLNFTYSRSHAFRYERKNTNPTLVRIELKTSAQQVCSPFPVPVLNCLGIWPCDVGSAAPIRIAPPILRSRSEFGAHSRALLLPPAFRGGTVLYCTTVLVPWPLVRKVWLVGSIGSAPPTPSRICR